MARVDREANAKKKAIDSLAAGLLNIDKEHLTSLAGDIAFQLLGPKPVRLMITGGAGSGKTTISSTIAERLNVPSFDFDEYVPGGYTSDGKEYRHRLVAGMEHLFNDLPYKTGWIVEHVEACNSDMVQAFKPTHCLLLIRPAKHLLRAAQARGTVAEDSDEDVSAREKRALESSEYAKMQFEQVPGEIVGRGEGWVLKKLG
jgi:hypothetical protein